MTDLAIIITAITTIIVVAMVIYKPKHITEDLGDIEKGATNATLKSELAKAKRRLEVVNTSNTLLTANRDQLLLENLDLNKQLTKEQLKNKKAEDKIRRLADDNYDANTNG